MKAFTQRLNPTAAAKEVALCPSVESILDDKTMAERVKHLPGGGSLLSGSWTPV